LHNGAEARVASLGPGFEQKRTAAAIWVLNGVHERYALNGNDAGLQQVVFRKDGVVPRFAICHDFCAPSVFCLRTRGRPGSREICLAPVSCFSRGTGRFAVNSFGRLVYVTARYHWIEHRIFSARHR
jgi:hypothetical protein